MLKFKFLQKYKKAITFETQNTSIIFLNKKRFDVLIGLKWKNFNLFKKNI